MANCTVDNMTAHQLREYVLSKQMGFTKEDIDTVEKLDRVLNLTRSIIKTAEIEVSILDKKVRATLHLSEGDKIERYVDKDTGQLILDSRVTDAVHEKFIKSRGINEAKEINNLPNNIVKANIGTKVHKALQTIMNSLILDDKSGVIEINDSNEKLTDEGLKKIRKDLDISDSLFKLLKVGAGEILDQIIKNQKKIDPKGKVRIYTEQLIMDLADGVSEGGTIDVLAVYSDMRASIFDYKTITPKGQLDSLGNVTDPNWIPTYKYEDFDIQLGRLADILTSRYGIKEIYSNRIVPIQVNIAYDPKKEKDENLIEKLVGVRMGESIVAGNEHLMQIPVKELNTGIEELDKRVLELNRILHNDITEYADRPTTALASKIDRKKKVLARLIVKQDIQYMIKDIKLIAETFSSGFGNYANISDEFIDGEPNPSYLSMEQLNKLHEELLVYEGILKSSGQLLVELEVDDKSTQDAYNYDRLKLLEIVANFIPIVEKERLTRTFSKEDIESAKDTKSLGIVDRLFRALGLQQHPAFMKLKRFLSKANDNKRIAAQKLFNDITLKIKDLEDWGARNGISGIDIFKKLIDPKDMDLHDKHSKEFYQDLKKAQSEKDNKWLNKNLKVKEDASEIYNKNYKTFLLNRGINEKTTDPSEVKLIKFWKENNNIKDVKYNYKRYRIYYDIVENVDSKYYSEGYNYMRQTGNEPLLEFWNFYTEKMSEFRFMLGLMRQYDKLPNNFIPWIRADIINSLFQGGYNFATIKDNMESMFKIKSDTQTFGSKLTGRIDPTTGKELNDIPVYYLNPLTDTNGEINQGLKSIDLGKSLFIFGSMALNYYHMKNEVEPYVEAMRDLIATVGMRDLNKFGGEKKAGNLVSKITGKEIDHVKMFDMMVDYHLYGVKIQDKKTKTVQAILGAARFQQVKELSFAVLTWIGNLAQISTGTWTEGIKGYYYTKEHWKKSLSIAGTDKYRALTYIFEPSSDREFVKSKNLSINKLSKILSVDTLMYGFRKGSELISNHVLISMLQNYGYDSEGNIRRLANLPENSKSLFDIANIVNDSVVIEGMINEDGSITEKFTEFRNAVVSVANRITGDMNSEDVNAANMQLITNLGMRFKNWMPKMLDERFGGMRYNPLTNSIEEGRYWSLITNLDKDQASWGKFIITEFLPEVTKFLFHVGTFGGYKYKVNEHRAKALLNKYKMDNPNSAHIQRMTIKDFMDYKQGQIGAAATELRIILAIVTVLAALGGDWDEDDSPDYKKAWTSRTMFRVLNRMRMEIAFFANTKDWYRLLRFPFPVVGLLDDAQLLLRNTMDELGDWQFGEENERRYLARRLFGANKEGKRDKKPVGYESIQWLPGYKAIRMFEIFKQHEELEY